jgi:hypothetical protein
VSSPARALAFLRTSRLVAARSGFFGLAELVVARAAPNRLSVRRAFLLSAPTAGGVLHPELDPRAVRALEPGLVPLFARLTADGEPEITPLSAAALEARFAAGETLGLFHRDGELASLVWSGPGPLPFNERASLPLEPGERTIRGAVTLAWARRQGFARAAFEHVRAALADEGATGVVALVNGFNRAFLGGLRREGFREVGRVKVVQLPWRRYSQATGRAVTGHDR